MEERAYCRSVNGILSLLVATPLNAHQGGVIATAFAADHPELVDGSIALIAPAGLIEVFLLLALFIAL